MNSEPAAAPQRVGIVYWGALDVIPSFVLVDFTKSYNFHGSLLTCGSTPTGCETLDSQPSMLNIFADFLE
ncbi:MAG: hypothetical protein V2B20_21035 [Pseudomonadota bacterium]